MLITAHGETKTAKEWADLAGITPHQVLTRLASGRYTSEEAIRKEPKPKPPSKTDACRELDETPFENLPSFIQRLVKKDGYLKTRYGNFVREKYRKVFDRFYDEIFLPRFTK